MKNAITTIAVATTLAFGQAAFAQDSQQEWQAPWGRMTRSVLPPHVR